MKKRQIFILFTALLSLSSFKSFAEDIPYGIVNFGSCATESKYGKKEQESFEKLREQMTSLMGDVEKELNEMATKFQDAEFMDSLSPEAEEEMKSRFQSRNEEYNRYQNQFMQLMQQANMKLTQTLSNHISKASETIANKMHLPMVVREEVCFFYNPSFDITSSIIEEMDKNYEKESSKKDAPPAVDQQEK